MTRTWSALLAALALTAFAAPALAQKPPPEITYQCKTIIDISDDENVFGTTVGPDGERIQALRSLRHKSLIKNRSHFIPEMLKSAERI